MLIVAATDFSEGASLAVERAARLAEAREARMYLVHVCNEAPWGSLRDVLGRRGRKKADPCAAANELLEAHVGGLARRLGHRVEGVLLRGSASDALADFVATRRPDLLVMGAHGEKWLRYTLIGGTALKVLRRSEVAVLVVRRSPRGVYGKTIVAVDLSDRAVTVAGAAFALLPDAEHHLVHAYHVPFEGRMRLVGSTEREIDRFRASGAPRGEAWARRPGRAESGNVRGAHFQGTGLRAPDIGHHGTAGLRAPRTDGHRQAFRPGRHGAFPGEHHPERAVQLVRRRPGGAVTRALSMRAAMAFRGAG